MTIQLADPATRPARPPSRRRWLVLGICLLAGAAVLTAVLTRKLWRTKDAPGAVSVPTLAAAPKLTDNERAAILDTFTRPVRAVWGLLDHVSLYQRGGFIEHYGADLRERRGRPIAIERTILQVTDGQAWLMWWPERTPAVGPAELLEVAFAGAAPTQGTLTVGMLLKSGDVYLFGHDFAARSSNARSSATQLPFFPKEFLAALQTPTTAALARADNRLRARLPEALRAQLQRDGAQAVQCWFLNLGGLAGTEVAFDRVALLRHAETEQPASAVTLAGAVRGGGKDTKLTVVAMLESGQNVRQDVQPDGKFALAGLPADEPVSLRVEHLAQDHYADAGRWFIPGDERSALVIDLASSFSNPDQRKPDPKERVAHPLTRSGYADLYAAHARQIWNGLDDYPQEFAGKTFSNNINHIDRDRFFDNPDRAFRVIHLGSSCAVALQVRPCDRYNLLMESELGVRLGRPVEVVTLGRNNGDIAANFTRIRDYAMKFQPDVILLEHGSYLMAQLHPELLRRQYGYDAAHTHLDNFFYDAKGALTFRPFSPDWPLHVQKADQSALTPGVPFHETLRVPMGDMHPLGQEAYKYVADIMRHYRAQFPGVKIMIHTGLDQAQAHGKYDAVAKRADGTTIPVGAEVFMKNMAELAAREKFACIQPPLPRGFNDQPESYLTFVHDAHFSPRGHQWLARHLSIGLIEALGLQDLTEPKK